jgi:hypothetical protein
MIMANALLKELDEDIVVHSRERWGDERREEHQPGEGGPDEENSK